MSSMFQKRCERLRVLHAEASLLTTVPVARPNALGRLCTLQGRQDEASRWFAEERTILDADDARPALAWVGDDEALNYVRRNDPGDRERALSLLEAARWQFAEIGMTGWTKRGDELHPCPDRFSPPNTMS